MRAAFARIRKIRALSAADWMLLPRALRAVLAARARLLLPFGWARNWTAASALLAACVGRAVAAAGACVPGGRIGLVRAVEYYRLNREIYPRALRYRLLKRVIPMGLDLIGIKSMH